MTYVILGANLKDAQSAAMQRREQDRGKSVRLVTVNGVSDARGLPVTDWEATPLARLHPNYERASEALICASENSEGV